MVNQVYNKIVKINIITQIKICQKNFKVFQVYFNIFILVVKHQMYLTQYVNFILILKFIKQTTNFLNSLQVFFNIYC